MDDLKVAAVCMTARPGRVAENLDRIRSLALKAAYEGARIVCFPELSVTGYVLKNPADVYQGLDYPKALEGILQLSRDTGVVIIAGLMEDSGEARPYITQVMAGPHGLIGLYRKTHLSPHEKGIYQAGGKIDVYHYNNTVFGVQLCYEAHFPEISTVMALMGADILFIPHASPRGEAQGKLKSWLRHLTARAFDNGVYVVACNQVGTTDEAFSFPGVAVILGPNGQELARYVGEEETILFATLGSDLLREVREHPMRYFIPSRRPELYKERLGVV